MSLYFVPRVAKEVDFIRNAVFDAASLYAPLQGCETLIPRVKDGVRWLLHGMALAYNYGACSCACQHGHVYYGDCLRLLTPGG